MKNHYTYKIIDPQTNQYYIGVRSCECNPQNDDYMRSYRSWKPEDESRLKKEIIKNSFETREQANKHEINLISSFIKDEIRSQTQASNELNDPQETISYHCLGNAKTQKFKFV